MSNYIILLFKSFEIVTEMIIINQWEAIKKKESFKIFDETNKPI
jgi:hypothetical protein